MNNVPYFSVIIPLYNKEKDILNTLESLLQQSFSNFEVIIVNDGSTDNSVSVAKTIQDPRINIFLKENEGVAKTRNYAVTKANAEHIVFLDADDYWYPNHLENLHNLITHFPEHLWYATAYEKQHRDKFITPMQTPLLKEREPRFVSVENYFEYSCTDPLAWTSAVCFKKLFFEGLQGFDFTITMGAGEDTDLWLRAALEAPLAFSKEITARHKLDGSNRISNSNTLLRRFMDFDKYENITVFQPYLKHYLDINRFSLAIKYKMAGDSETAKKYQYKIASESLSLLQKMLLKLPSFLLKGSWRLKNILEKLSLRVSAFKY
ncbi:MAG: glycosyltransferase family 2 protein [Flavobacteriaceae bacterium]|nr:glycosyltransferase family 2 protein [Flavobacteriaceae bacterium]